MEETIKKTIEAMNSVKAGLQRIVEGLKEPKSVSLEDVAEVVANEFNMCPRLVCEIIDMAMTVAGEMAQEDDDE